MRILWPGSTRRRPRTEDEATAAIRNHLAAMGYRVEYPTDDQIRTGVKHLGTTARNAGIPASAAARAVIAVGRAGHRAAVSPKTPRRQNAS